MDREAQRRGFDQAPRRVVFGDGAAWIWNPADDLFPGARQIVDLFHAKPHLSDVGKAIDGAGTDLSRQWARLRHDELDAGHLRALCHALRAHAPTDSDARRCWDYMTHHRARRVSPFREWLNGLDVTARGRIQARVLRFETGNLGDQRRVGQGTWEARCDFGPGYGIYFGQVGSAIVLLLLGGDKSTQRADIRRAQRYWAVYMEATTRGKTK